MTGTIAEAQAHLDAGRFAEAEAATRRILERDPGSPEASRILGIALRRIGRPEAALEELRRLEAARPLDADVMVEVANTLVDLGDRDGAIAAYERALRAEPRHARAHYNLAVVLQDANVLDAAIEHYAAAWEARPGFAKALVNWGTALMARGDVEPARDKYLRALELDAGDATAAYNLSELARESHREGRLEFAIGSFEALLHARPGDARAHYNLGVVLQQAGRLEEAIEHYRAALEEEPTLLEALLNWGAALRSQGDPQGALQAFERILAVDPRHAGALNNIGTLVMNEGQLARAREIFVRIAEWHPGDLAARLNLGILDLYDQEFSRAWEAYELRLLAMPEALAISSTGLARLRREDLVSARRPAILKEQGLGDQILFSTLLPELVRQGIEGLVEVDERLIAAYRRSLPGLDFVASPELPGAMAACDGYVEAGALAGWFRRSRESFSAQPAALLRPDPARVDAMRAGLPPGPGVGISWKSFQDAGRGDVARQKSIPVECFAVFEGEGTHLVDLQYGNASADRRELDARHPGLRVDPPALDRFDDLEGVLAAIEACDLIVTGSNVTAHLAGAIGKRTWLVYLAGVAPFHYWVPGGDGKCLWYPSVEILTDKAWTTWEAAFRFVRERWKNEARRG